MVSASALSYASPRLPTDDSMPASSRRSVYQNRELLRPAIAMMDERPLQRASPAHRVPAVVFGRPALVGDEAPPGSPQGHSRKSGIPRRGVRFQHHHPVCVFDP